MPIWLHLCLAILPSVVLLCVHRWYLHCKLASSANQRFPPRKIHHFPESRFSGTSLIQIQSQNSYPCSLPPGHIRSLSVSLYVYGVGVYGGGGVKLWPSGLPGFVKSPHSHNEVQILMG